MEHAAAPIAARARRLVERTANTPLRPLWRASYELLLRALAAAVRGRAATSVYVGGSFGVGEPVYGVSDIDLIAVAPTAQEAERVRRRWAALRRRLVPLSPELAHVFVYEEKELREVVAESAFTYGLASRPGLDRAAFTAAASPADEGGLLLRPGVFPTAEWRRLAGRERRPADLLDAQQRRVVAWLELQFWTRRLYNASLRPSEHHVPFLCVKLVAEPARIWLALRHGERLLRRRDVLERALELLPEEELVFRAALDQQASLPRARVELDEVVPPFLRLGERIAALIHEEAAPAGAEDVRLLGTPAGPLVPLVDWRARTLPGPLEERLAPLSAERVDVATLARAVDATEAAPYPAIRSGRLLLLPARGRDRLRLRSVQCAVTDPVSFALLDGAGVASFPELRGWSARDCARRAVAEHRARLRGDETPNRRWPRAAPEVGSLLAAARAALFATSVERNEPELAVTPAAIGEQLAAELPGAVPVVDEALAILRDAGATAGSGSLVRSLQALVARLPAYADGAA